MTDHTPPPDFAHTRDALSAHARACAALDVWDDHPQPDHAEGLAIVAQIDDALARVGEAFARDTAAFNHPDVAGIVRCPSGLAFVRRVAAEQR